MNSLITINNLDKLPESLKVWAVNRIGKKPIKLLTENEVNRSCSEIIAKSFADSGQLNVTSEMLQFQTQSLLDELSGKFKDLTIDEVKEAFKKGIRGETGPYFGLCAKTYHQFIKHYFESKERSEAMRVYLDLNRQEIVKDKPTPEQQNEILKKGIKLAYEVYVKSGELPFYSAPYYDYLKKNNLVNWSKEQIEEMKIEAETEYRGRLIEDRDNRVINTLQYKAIIENLNTNQTFKNVCKKIGLKYWFEACKLTNFNFDML